MRAARVARLVLIGFCLWGCSILAPRPTPLPIALPTQAQTPGTDARPDDFSLEYHWSEGSLPPPHHYEYQVRLKPSGQGQVVYWPDYPSFENVPEWTEDFEAAPEQLDRLYQDMVEQGLLTEAWQAQDRPPVGGSSEWISVTAQGQQIEIPPFVVADQEDRAKAIYTMAREIVPQAVWDRLEAKRQEYINTYQKP